MLLLHHKQKQSKCEWWHIVVSSCECAPKKYHILISSDLFHDYYLHWDFDNGWSHSIVMRCLHSIGFRFDLLLLDSFRLLITTWIHLWDTFDLTSFLFIPQNGACFQFRFFLLLFTYYIWHIFRMIVKSNISRCFLFFTPSILSERLYFRRILPFIKSIKTSN